MQTEQHADKAAGTGQGRGGLKLSSEQLDGLIGEARRSAASNQPVAGKDSPDLEIDRLAKMAANSVADHPGEKTLSLNDLTQMLRQAHEEVLSVRKRGPNVALRRPLRIYQGSTPAQLDVNLLANLARWVGYHKSTFGTQILRELVEIYAMTGHLSPTVASVLVRVEAFSFLPDESHYHEVSDDDLAIALLSLHGIVYGAGVLPAEPPDPAAVARDLKWTVREEDSTPEEDAAEKSETVPSSGEESPAAEAKPKMPRDYERALSALREAFARPASDESPSVSPEPEAEVESGPAQATAEVAPAEPAHPSDLTDDEWERIRPLVPVTKSGGRPGKYDKREIVNAILFHLKTGRPWRGLPSDLPPWKIAHHYYRTWTGDGVWDPISETLGLTDAAAAPRSERPAVSASEQPFKVRSS